MPHAARLFTSLLLLVLGLATFAGAQDPAADKLTVKALEADRKAIKDEAGLDDALRTALLAEYDQALQFLKQAETDRRRAAQYEAARKSAPDRLAAAKAELARETRVALPTPAAGTPITELEAGLQEATQTAREATARAEQFTQEGDQRAARLPVIPTELSKATARLPKIDEALVAPAGEGESERLTPARKIRLRAERAAVKATVDALENEATWYRAGQELLTTERDLAVRAATQAEKVRGAWQNIVQTQRKARAEEAQREAERSREDVSHEELKGLADDNAELAQLLPELAAAVEKASNATEETKHRLKNMEERAKDVTDVIADVGLTDAVGAILRERRAWLNDRRRDFRLFMSDNRDELAKLQIRKFQLDQQRTALTDLDFVVKQFMADVAADTPAGRREAIAKGARRLLEQKRSYIDEILAPTANYLQLLREIKTTEEKLSERASEFGAFIDARILWIRSALPIWDPKGMPESSRATAWVANATSWATTGRALFGDVERYWLLYVMTGLLVGGLLLWRRRMGRALDRAGDVAAQPDCVSFGPTVKGLILTALIAASIPLVLLLLSWRLGAVARHDFTHALAVTLQSTGWLLFGLECCRHLCRPKGLCDAHFDLAPTALANVRKNMIRIMCLLPLHFLGQLFEQAIDLSAMDSMGRGAFILQTLLFALFMASIFGLRHGILSHGLHGHAAFRRSVFGLAAGFPLAVAVLAAFGYYLTALALADRVPWMLAIIVGWMLFYWLAKRFLRVSRRSLLLREEGTTEPANLEDDDKRERFESAESQSRRLLLSLTTVCMAAGTWSLWANVLPALGYWRELELWSVSSTVDGKVEQVAITFVDLLMAVVYAAVTAIAARSIPGMLRITVFRRLPEGDRLAFAKVAQYLIVFAGMFLVLATIRLQWAHMQWAVAGLSVGLGFGLQEIFANFISGLIILFERPIRVGDMVTVGQTLGKVTEVRVRSTTIMDFDMRELIVPNKDFISKEIVNWTLSTPVTRVVIPVSVSVDADPERVREILTEVAGQHPRVADDPAPWAVFGAFGDGALQFKLNVYLATRADWLAVVNGLHDNIVRAFRAASIDFALRRSEVRVQRPEANDDWSGAIAQHDEPGSTPGV